MRASRMLERFSFPHHVFKHRISRIIRGRVTERLIPAFPSYLFVFTTDEMLAKLHQLWPYIGMSSFVQGANGEVAIADVALKQLRDRAIDNDVLPTNNEVNARFVFGDKVQIVTGTHVAFGCDGIYQYTVRPGRVCILSPWLGQLVPIEVDESDIELAGERKVKPHRFRRRRRRGGYRYHTREVAAAA
jgi:hypothetical protein